MEPSKKAGGRGIPRTMGYGVSYYSWGKSRVDGRILILLFKGDA